MRWPARFTNSPIGLDLGTHTFKAIQVKRTASGWELVNHVSLARVHPDSPIDQADIARLEGVLDRRGFSGQDVIVSVPNSKLMTSMLELPARGPGVPLELIAALEFARVHKQEPGKVTISTWELPAPARASKATYMLGIGAASADLESHIDLIESGSLNVVAMDEPHSAGARGCMHLTEADSGLVGIIDLGWTEVTLTILMDHAIVYTRKLADAGTATLCREAAEAMADDGVSVDEAIWRMGFMSAGSPTSEDSERLDTLNAHFASLTKEVGKAFNYASHRYSDSTLSKAILIGGGAAIPGVAKQVESLLGLRTDIGEVRKAGPGVEDPGPALCSALGLALWTEESR